MVEAEQTQAMQKASATVPAAIAKQDDATPPNAGLPVSAAAPPLVFDSDVDNNNKSWFQARSG